MTDRTELEAALIAAKAPRLRRKFGRWQTRGGDGRWRNIDPERFELGWLQLEQQTDFDQVLPTTKFRDMAEAVLLRGETVTLGWDEAVP